MPGTQASEITDYHAIGATLFGDVAALVICRIADYRAYLQPSELALIENAIDKRAYEFSTGRHCAHLALQQIGVEAEPLLKGNQREPLWPDDVIGSISHCRDLAGAVVAKKSNLVSIGFDVENRKQLDPRIVRHVCTPDESAWLEKQTPDMRQLALLFIFSIKEAIFKCVFQACGVSLRFSQCEIVPDFNNRTAKVNVGIDPGGTSLAQCRVRFWYNEHHVFSGALLTRS